MKGIKKLTRAWEIPGGLVVRIPHFHCHGPGSVPGQGTEMRGQKKKEKKETNQGRNKVAKGR